ncbi:TPA: coniferyl-alcohol dehydrogenase [Pseudomonas aeruginosa]
MLQGKRILITGVSSGIGEETARLVQSLGAKVIGVDIHPPRLDLEQFHQADLGRKDSLDRLLTELPDGIDGLANIAGLPPTRPAAQVVAVNLVGLIYLTQGVLPKLADGASIVNLASLAGIGWPEAVDTIKQAHDLTFEKVAEFCKTFAIDDDRSYFFTKEALLVWTIQNRWTWRSRGIRMNAVSPGPVDTPILKDFIETLGERAEEDMRTMDRPGRPSDIAPVVAFLLSDGSQWLRGINIPADGGMHTHILANTYGL